MSYNTKNYVEQGGDRLVIRGSMEFKEGAGITGFPSDAAFFVFNLDNVELSDIMQTPLEVTDIFPLELFESAVGGERPVLFKNASLNGYRYNVLSTATDGGNMIVGLAGMPYGNSGALFTIVTVVLFRDDDKVYLRANSNDHLAALLSGQDVVDEPVETDRSVAVEEEKKARK